MSNNHVERYGWGGDSPAHTHEYLAMPVIERLTALGIGSAIDVGCGNGALCSAMSETIEKVVGCDTDTEGVEFAQTANPLIKFYQCGVDNSPQEIIDNHGKFDAVVSTEVIEHLYSPHALPEFARKLLNPGGVLLITTPYHGYLKNLVLSLLNKWDSHLDPLWHGGHIKFWSKKSLTLLLHRSGFDVIEFHGVGRFPYLWKSMMLVARVRGD